MLDRQPAQRLLDQRRIASDQQHATCGTLHGLAKRREILAFGLTSEDKNRFPAKAAQRGDGSADVGSFRIVVPLDAAAHRDALKTVRQSFEAPETGGKLGKWNANRVGK